MTSPTCGHCAAPLIRHPAENPSKFRRRKFCNIACAMTSRKRAFAPKHCKSCNAPLIRRQKEADGKFERRTHCSQLCWGKWRTISAERRTASLTKACPCGAVITRGMNRSAADFEQRKYCSLSCSAKARHQAERVTANNPQKRYSTQTPAQRAALKDHPYSYNHQYRQYIKPPAPGTPFEDPASWLATHAVTKCPDRYCAPVVGARPIPSTKESAA